MQDETTMDTPNGSVRLLALLALVLTMTGCRTYGGYGSEDASLVQIGAANAYFAQQLGRAEADLRTLEQAAASNASLATYAAQYRAFVLVHQAFLDAHQELEADLEGGGSYREVHRALGAIISEQNLVSDLYERLLLQIWQTTQGDSTVHAFPDRGTYEIMPPYYSAVTYRQHKLDMNTSLGRN
jgi:hypothetical protein